MHLLVLVIHADLTRADSLRNLWKVVYGLKLMHFQCYSVYFWRFVSRLRLKNRRQDRGLIVINHHQLSAVKFPNTLSRNKTAETTHKRKKLDVEVEQDKKIVCGLSSGSLWSIGKQNYSQGVRSVVNGLQQLKVGLLALKFIGPLRSPPGKMTIIRHRERGNDFY